VTELIRTVRTKLGERAPGIGLDGSAYRLAIRFAREISAMETFTDLRIALGALRVIGFPDLTIRPGERLSRNVESNP
jgi:hypothetical protein